MVARIQFRRDTAANWAAYNPIPLAGEPCYETDTGNFKIGDGHSTYSELPTFVFDMSGYVAKSELSNYVTLTQLQEALANINTGGGSSNTNPGDVSNGGDETGNGNQTTGGLTTFTVNDAYSDYNDDLKYEVGETAFNAAITGQGICNIPVNAYGSNAIVLQNSDGFGQLASISIGGVNDSVMTGNGAVFISDNYDFVYTDWEETSPVGSYNGNTDITIASSPENVKCIIIYCDTQLTNFSLKGYTVVGGNSSGSEDSGNGNTSISNLIPLSDMGSMRYSLWDTSDALTSDTTIALEDEGWGAPDALITTANVSNIAADHIILDVTYISSSGEQKMLSYYSKTTSSSVITMEVIYDAVDYTSWSQSTYVPISSTGLVAIPFAKGSKHIILHSETDINFKVVGFTDGEPQLS